jgi:predicted nuclease with RNAse H fold
MVLYGAVDPAASPQRWSACALLDDSLSLRDLGRCQSDSEIVTFFPKTVWGVGLDAPCSLPMGLGSCCLQDHPPCDCQPLNPWKGRTCERDLVRAGFRVFYPSRNAFAKEWFRRGLRLKRELEEAGLRVLEVYPYATKGRLFGPLPSKTTRRGRQALQRGLRRLLRSIPHPHHLLLTHHELDAVLGAYTCYLHSRGQAEQLGDPKEGVVIIPRRKPI